MMGAIVNIGAVIGEGTMIDMGAVLGGRATGGKNCHIGAGAVVVEDVPAGAVVAGVPARVIKQRDDKTDSKTGLEEGLRQL